MSNHPCDSFGGCGVRCCCTGVHKGNICLGPNIRNISDSDFQSSTASACFLCLTNNISPVPIEVQQSLAMPQCFGGKHIIMNWSYLLKNVYFGTDHLWATSAQQTDDVSTIFFIVNWTCLSIYLIFICLIILPINFPKKVSFLPSHSYYCFCLFHSFSSPLISLSLSLSFAKSSMHYLSE